MIIIDNNWYIYIGICKILLNIKWLKIIQYKHYYYQSGYYYSVGIE